MGAFSPVPLDDHLQNQIMRQIIEPTISRLKEEGKPFVGFLFAGIMITPTLDPVVLEFNARLGDPESEAILVRLQSDLFPLCLAALQGGLDQMSVEWDARSALNVYMVSGGYPEFYETGYVIQGLESSPDEDCFIFHGGTLQQGEDIVTGGGRVLCVTALGSTLLDAHQKAYRQVGKLSWPDHYFRTDIGLISP